MATNSSNKPSHGVPVGRFYPRRLAQRRYLQLGENPLRQYGLITATRTAQQRGHTGSSQLLGCGGSRDGRQYRRSGMVLQIRKSLQRLRIEFKQHRPQSADSLMQRPDRLLVLTREHFDCAGLARVGRQPTMQMTIVAQDMRKHRGIIGIRLPAGLSVTFPIARDRTRIDRIHHKPGLDQRDDDQVLVRLDRYRRVIRPAAVLCDQSQ
jgi:hypothetical protein